MIVDFPKMAKGHGPEIEAFAAWLYDQETNEDAPDRFRHDQEFAAAFAEDLERRQREGGSNRFSMYMQCMFWGFLGAMDYLSDLPPIEKKWRPRTNEE